VTFPASFTWKVGDPVVLCVRNTAGSTVIATPEMVDPAAPIVAAMSDAIAKIVVVIPLIVTRSPTLSSVRNLVPAPVRALDPVAVNDGFALTVSLAVGVVVPMPIAPLLATRNFELPSHEVDAAA
jgi:hypothetical protein